MEKDFEKLAKELIAFLDVQTPETEVVATPHKKWTEVNGQMVETDVFDGIVLKPANEDRTIHNLGRISDFARYHRLSHYASIENIWDKEKEALVKNIYIFLF